jgi:glycosyltransferase involved in cell wall biosynthesis
VTRLFGITVAGGLSSENRVFARLLSERGDRYDALVVVHEQNGAGAGVADDFAALADSATIPLDTGWRPNPWSRRGNPGRAPVALRYRHRVDRITAAADRFEAGAIYSSQQHYDCLAASKVARSLGAPQIVHLHYTVGPWLRRVVLKQLRTTDRVVAVSNFVRQQAIRHGVPEHRITTIHNPVSAYVAPDAATTRALRGELGLADAQYVFGLVGRFDPGKGHLDAIAAFERVASQRDDVALVLVGSGRIERKIGARARHSPVADRIVTTGQRSDVPELLSVFNALVHPATQDPCPLAVLEAMAAALPVVAYDDGGLPELVESGTSGILVDHGDVGALAEAMLALRDDEAMGCELGAAAAKRVASDFAPADAGASFADLVTSIA